MYSAAGPAWRACPVDCASARSGRQVPRVHLSRVDAYTTQTLVQRAAQRAYAHGGRCGGGTRPLHARRAVACADAEMNIQAIDHLPSGDGGARVARCPCPS